MIEELLPGISVCKFPSAQPLRALNAYLIKGESGTCWSIPALTGRSAKRPC